MSDSVHERAATVLRAAVKERREAARDLREQAAQMEAEARRIEQAAAGERWHELGGYLKAADVESLCECSPADLLSDEEAP
jgi:hypothetical protein